MDFLLLLVWGVFPRRFPAIRRNAAWFVVLVRSAGTCNVLGPVFWDLCCSCCLPLTS